MLDRETLMVFVSVWQPQLLRLKTTQLQQTKLIAMKNGVYYKKKMGVR